MAHNRLVALYFRKPDKKARNGAGEISRVTFRSEFASPTLNEADPQELDPIAMYLNIRRIIQNQDMPTEDWIPLCQILWYNIF